VHIQTPPKQVALVEIETKALLSYEARRQIQHGQGDMTKLKNIGLGHGKYTNILLNLKKLVKKSNKR